MTLRRSTQRDRRFLLTGLPLPQRLRMPQPPNHSKHIDVHKIKKKSGSHYLVASTNFLAEKPVSFHYQQAVRPVGHFSGTKYISTVIKRSSNLHKFFSVIEKR